MTTYQDEHSEPGDAGCEAEERLAAGPHPAGRRGYRPGVRMVELAPEVSMWDAAENLEVILATPVRVLECLSCGALLAIGSPGAAHHVESHRGPRWRRRLRDIRIRIRRMHRRRRVLHTARTNIRRRLWPADPSPPPEDTRLDR